MSEKKYTLNSTVIKIAAIIGISLAILVSVTNLSRTLIGWMPTIGNDTIYWIVTVIAVWVATIIIAIIYCFVALIIQGIVEFWKGRTHKWGTYQKSNKEE